MHKELLLSHNLLHLFAKCKFKDKKVKINFFVKRKSFTILKSVRLRKVMMSESESPTSLSDLMQNLELSQYSASLAQELSDAFSSYTSSEITGSPASVRSRIFLSPLVGEESLRSQIRQRDNIIDAMRLKYSRTISQLTEKLVQTNNDITQIKAQYKDKLEKMKAQINRTQSENESQLKKEIDEQKAKNRARRDNLTFSKLPEIDEETYAQLKSQKPSSISIPQFVALQLYEHDQEFIKKLGEAQKLRDEALSEMEKINTKLENESALLVSEKELRISLEQKLASISTKNIAAKPISADVSTANAQRIKALEKENDELRNSCNVALQRCNETALQSDAQKKENYKLQQSVTKLKAENQSLSAQIATINAFANRQEGYLQDLKSENSELKRIRDDFYYKFINSAEQKKNDVGSALQADLQHITEHSRNSIEYIRSVSEKIHEREVQTLQKTLDQSLDEIKELRLQLRKSEETRSTIQSEYATIQTTHNAEISRLQSNLKTKEQELRLLQTSYDQLQATNEDTQGERDKYQTSFNLVMEEYNKLKLEIESRENENQGLKDKIQTYEKLEGELDQAIENMDLNGIGPLAVPSDANRRMKQSIQLSKRVMTLTKVNKDLQDKLEQAKQELEEKTEENESLKNQVTAAGQPQQIFVSMMTEKQDENNKLRKKIALLSEKVQELELEKKSIQRDFSIISTQQENIKYSDKMAKCPFSQAQEDEPTHEAVDPAPFIIIRRD